MHPLHARQTYITAMQCNNTMIQTRVVNSDYPVFFKFMIQYFQTLGHDPNTSLRSDHGTLYNMDGNSEIGAHVRSNPFL